MFGKRLLLMFQFSCHLIYSNPLPVACVFYKHKRNGVQQQQVHMLAKTMIANHVKLGGRGGDDDILCQSDTGY